MMTDDTNDENEECDDSSKDHNHDQETNKTTITPLSLTYQRGPRLVFVASKRQGTMSSTSAQPLDKGKQKIKEEEEDHEVEREFEIIQVDNDEENEPRITKFLLQNRNTQIEYLQADLDRAKSLNDALDMENRQLGAQIAI